jgi:D-Tyr-tRNAtyr deacylase
MAMSIKLSYEVAKVVVDEIGPEKAERLLSRLVDLVIINDAPQSPKQSVINVRNQVLLILVDSQRRV